MNLSALILAKDEQDLIEDCLRQLTFANEIIILDQNSQDETVKIAQKYTKKIFSSKSADFSLNRNTLAKKATSEWLLYLDCDERITDDLKKEIQKTITNAKYQAYFIPRKNYVLGKEVRHGGWWPDYVPRLFKKENLISWRGIVHESPVVKGSFGYFKSPIVHLSARSFNLMINKSIRWAKEEANLYYVSKNPKVTVPKVIKAMVKEFARRYILTRGFLDGTIGLIEAIYQAIHQAIIFVYLWEIQNNSQDEFEQEKRRIHSISK